MIGEHWFWWLVMIACIVWYSTITVYVAIKGVGDIKNMLRRLTAKHPRPEESEERPRVGE